MCVVCLCVCVGAGSVDGDSATLRNQKPFAGTPFRVSVSSAQLIAAINAVNLQFNGTDLGTALDQWGLRESYDASQLARMPVELTPSNSKDDKIYGAMITILSTNATIYEPMIILQRTGTSCRR